MNSKKILDIFRKKCEVLGKPPIVDWGRDLRLVKKLLEVYSVEELIRELVCYCETEPNPSILDFYAKRKK
jgi:hypothetical protein